EGRMAEAVLIPFLRSSGIRAVDRLMLSDPSPVVASGVTALLAGMPIRQTLVDGPTGDDDAMAFDCAQAPHSWQWDGVAFEPLVVERRASGADAAHACLLAVGSGPGRILIPGVLDSASESHLSATRDLRAQVVIIPRSGSDAASSEGFIHATHA